MNIEEQVQQLQDIDDQQVFKLFRVIRTICEMMEDRKYLGKAQFKEYEEEGGQEKLKQQMQSATNSGSYEALTGAPFIFTKNELYQVGGFDQRAVVSIQRTTSQPFSQDNLKTILKFYKNSDDSKIDCNVFKIILVLQGDPIKDRNKLIKFKKEKNKDDYEQKLKMNIEQLEQDNILELFSFDELLYNVTKHILVPQHIPLTINEKNDLLKKYTIVSNQLPKILKSDPVARYYGMKKGDVFKIVRDSETAGKYVTYRIVS